MLHKRTAFHQVFYGFDPQRVAGMSEKAMAAAMANPAIIRNRLKIRAAVKNAQAFLRLQDAHGSFDNYIWAFTGGRVIQNRWKTLESVPAKTDLSDTVSKALKQQGFTFVGSTHLLFFFTGRGAGQRPPGQLLPISGIEPGNSDLAAGC